MSTRHLLHPELRQLPELMPVFNFTAENLPRFREARKAAVVMGDAEKAGVIRKEVHIPVPGGPDVRCLLYRSQQQAPEAPAYLHIHGGGYVIGSPEMSDEVNLKIASRLGALVLSVDYRLAPEHPIPAPLEDCYAGLAWLHEQASGLGIDPNRIAVGGESAGGGLAAAVALHARDEGRYALCHQHLTYPMLDDRTGTAEQPGDPLVGEFVWNRDCNRFGWTAYLGSAPAAAPQVPARAESLAGLPPTWILTASLDLFRDENIDYANRLMRAGVHTDLAVYGGGCHAFQAIPKTALGWRYAKEHLSALAAGLGVTVK